MQNKTTVIVALVLILGIGALTYFQIRTAPEVSFPETVENEAAGGIMPNFEGLTAEAVAEHDSEESCWTIVNGEVYDLTFWISEHPGGAPAILQLCGTDGSALFNAQHGDFAQAKAALANFRIGTLAQ